MVETKTVSMMRTPKQEKLITQLLQSRWFSRKEFKVYMEMFHDSLDLKKDASELISTLLTQLRFRKAHGNKRTRARLKCSFCGSKEKVKRCWTMTYSHEYGTCWQCEEKLQYKQLQRDKIKEKNAERLADELDKPDEEREAKSDLFYEYEYPSKQEDIDEDKIHGDEQAIIKES